jgi:hypothetical protein
VCGTALVSRKSTSRSRLAGTDRRPAASAIFSSHIRRRVRSARSGSKASLEQLAPRIFVLEMNDDGLPIYRLAGRAVRNLFGADLTGKTFYSHWSDDSHKLLQAYFDASAASHRPFCLFSQRLKGTSAPDQLQTLFFPIRAEDGYGSQFIGVSLVPAHRIVPTGPPADVQQLQHIAFLPNDWQEKQDAPAMRAESRP